MTTAIYPNRIEDKEFLEACLSLSEVGNNTTRFFYNNNLIAKGYKRIVYGDHGPYIEFENKHIMCKLVDKFHRPAPLPNQLPSEKEAKFYYYWLTPIHTNLKVYLQIKPVNDLPNAPNREDGKPSKFNRKEGYADYKRGYYYIDPYKLSITR